MFLHRLSDWKELVWCILEQRTSYCSSLLLFGWGTQLLADRMKPYPCNRAQHGHRNGDSCEPVGGRKQRSEFQFSPKARHGCATIWIVSEGEDTERSSVWINLQKTNDVYIQWQKEMPVDLYKSWWNSAKVRNCTLLVWLTHNSQLWERAQAWTEIGTKITRPITIL